MGHVVSLRKEQEAPRQTPLRSRARCDKPQLAFFVGLAETGSTSFLNYLHFGKGWNTPRFGIHLNFTLDELVTFVGARSFRAGTHALPVATTSMVNASVRVALPLETRL